MFKNANLAIHCAIFCQILSNFIYYVDTNGQIFIFLKIFVHICKQIWVFLYKRGPKNAQIGDMLHILATLILHMSWSWVRVRAQWLSGSGWGRWAEPYLSSDLSQRLSRWAMSSYRIEFEAYRIGRSYQISEIQNTDWIHQLWKDMEFIMKY